MWTELLCGLHTHWYLYTGGQIKDLTKRYASDYMLRVRKLRADEDWWRETLLPYVPQSAADISREELEDRQIQGRDL